jgi:hypothetical protein
MRLASVQYGVLASLRNGRECENDGEVANECEGELLRLR